MNVSLYDGIGGAGLALLGAGLWLYDPAVALTAVGAILLIIGLAAARGESGERE